MGRVASFFKVFVRKHSHLCSQWGLSLNWMLPLSKLFIIHDCMVTGMEEILCLQRKMFAHLTVRRCSSDCCSRLNPAVFVLRRSLSIFPLHLSFVSLHFPFVLCSPCYYPDKKKKNPFAAPETLNWLFSDTSCNWLLITVLHHVLIFKSAVSAQRKGPLQCLAVIHSGCRETLPSCVGARGPPPEAHTYRLTDSSGRRWLCVTATSREMFTPHLAPVETIWTARTVLTFGPIWCTTSQVTREIFQNRWNIYSFHWYEFLWCRAYD